MRKTEKIKGITLISLVITIIVLLILAGVTIKLITGDNGIINRAQKSVTKIETEKEKELLVMAVAGTLDETLKLNMDELKVNILKELPYAKIKDTEGKFPLTVTLKYGIYVINEFGNVEKFKGITLDVEEMVLQIIDGVAEEKNIKATLIQMNGDISWKSEDDTIAKVDSNGKVTAVKEGTTKIIATCEEESVSCNIKVTKFVSINSIKLKIDGTEIDYSKTKEIQKIKDKEKTIEIIAEINDDATEDVKWYGTSSSLVDLTSSGDRKTKITLTLKGSINEYVLTAKNGAETVSKTLKLKIVEIEPIEAKNVTTSMMKNNIEVEYNSRIWNVMYADSKNIYLILRDIVAPPCGNGGFKGNQMTPYDSGTAMLTDITTNATTAARFPAVKDGWFSVWMKSGKNSTHDNMKQTLYLLDSNVWNGYKGELGKWAIGGPTMELFITSYDKIAGNGSNIFSKLAISSNVGYDYPGEKILVENVGIKAEILRREGIYELAAPGRVSSLDGKYNVWVNKGGLGTSSTGIYYGCRPVVCLNENVGLVLNSTSGKYNVIDT